MSRKVKKISEPRTRVAPSSKTMIFSRGRIGYARWDGLASRQLAILRFLSNFAKIILGGIFYLKLRILNNSFPKELWIPVGRLRGTLVEYWCDGPRHRR